MRSSDWSSDVCSSDLGGPSASRWQLDQLSRIAAIPRKGGVFDSGNTGAPSSNERISRSIRCAKTGSFLRLFWHIYSKFSWAKEPMRNKITAKLRPFFDDRCRTYIMNQAHAEHFSSRGQHPSTRNTFPNRVSVGFFPERL